MKLSRLNMVNQAVREKGDLALALSSLKGGLIDIIIAGKYQDDAMKAVVMPVIEKEIAGRIAAIDRDLKSWNVEID